MCMPVTETLRVGEGAGPKIIATWYNLMEEDAKYIVNDKE